jgi:protein-tyrosine phosphatase
MAEVVLKKHLQDKNMKHIEVSSAAITSGEIGNPVYHMANDILLKNGYNYNLWKNHKAKKVTLQDLHAADLILPMTREHYDFLVKMLNGDDSKIFMYRWFEAQQESHTALDLEDPWYGGMKEFEIALAQIEASKEEIIAFLN